MRFLALLLGGWVYHPYSWLIAAILRLRGIRVGRNFYIQGTPFLKIRGKASNILIGDDVKVHGGIDLRNRENGTIVIEEGVSFDDGCRIVAAREAIVTFRARSDIGNFCIFNCGASVTIGEDTMMAGYCYIQSSSHGMRRTQTVKSQPHTHTPIAIGRDVWLGAGATILPGVIVGDGAVVGARSIVNNDVPPFCIVAGIPAKVIGERSE
jgi:acetyltransferase-like isoleucine patch superfamily enzyme